MENTSTKPRRHSRATSQVGARIRGLREHKKLALRELAESAGLDWSWLARIERGEAAPGIETYEAIAKGLRVPLTKLFSPAPRSAA